MGFGLVVRDARSEEVPLNERIEPGMKRFVFTSLVTVTILGSATLPSLGASGAVTEVATLIAPTTGAYVGTFTEQCGKNGKASVETYLAQPFTLTKTQYLAIDQKGTSTFSATVAGHGESVSITAFGGDGETGCIPVGTPVSLVVSPGGLLKGQLVIVGHGTIIAPQ